MSVSVNQILNDAKRLVSRLRDHDSTADTIISQTQTLYKNVEAMKEYNEEVNEQNVTNQLRNRPMLLCNVQQENKHIRDLLQENRELKDMLEEQQSAMEFIMKKYRQQATYLINSTSVKKDNSYANSTQELQKLADNICEIADVMKSSVKLDDVSFISEQEKITKLITENKGLRELLDISRTYGSLQLPLNTPEMADKEIQTESDST
ncbi:FGFR1 oncogene partner 2 homolog [Caerostris darwini]|uniref:FGFR1 oncogene partner 2 homolog n=1 Tax=Caerostris darwini TaxID=1538125 RepID=A0AAV4PZ76_9ARAC|nr:FGFR1 oncogene partner 2 homolog [Caerostris darwini]